MQEREKHPEAYKAIPGWYSGGYDIRTHQDIPPVVLEDMHEYYAELLSDYDRSRYQVHGGYGMDALKKEKDKHLGLRIDSELHYKLHYISQYEAAPPTEK